MWKRRESGQMSEELPGQSMLFAEDFPVKTSPSLEHARVLLGSDPDCSSPLSLSRRTPKQKLSSWRMCQDFYQATKDAISESSSLHWPTQGIATLSGEYWTRNSLEWPNDVAVCSLSQVLEPHASERYSLSPKAASGILRRSSRRGKTLPPLLEAALEAVAGRPTPTE